MAAVTRALAWLLAAASVGLAGNTDVASRTAPMALVLGHFPLDGTRRQTPASRGQRRGRDFDSCRHPNVRGRWSLPDGVDDVGCSSLRFNVRVTVHRSKVVGFRDVAPWSPGDSTCISRGNRFLCVGLCPVEASPSCSFGTDGGKESPGILLWRVRGWGRRDVLLFSGDRTPVVLARMAERDTLLSRYHYRP